MLDNETLDGGIVAPVRYANFGPRFLAAILDFLVTLPLGVAIFYFTGPSPNFAIYLVIVLLVMLYKPVMEKLYGATLGKMAAKLRVIDENGGNISWGQAFMRYLPWAIGAIGGVYLAYQMFQVPGYTDIDGFTEYGVFMQKYQANNDPTVNYLIQGAGVVIPLVSALIMLGNKQRRAAHDTLAESYVIHTKPTE